MSNLIAVATAAMSRIIESEFHDVPNARRDADRAAVRIASLIAQGIEAATAAETVAESPESRAFLLMVGSRLLAVLGYYRDEMPPEAVKAFQEVASLTRLPEPLEDNSSHDQH